MNKENALTGLIMALIVVVAFVLAAISISINSSIDYDIVKNLFFSSLLILLAIVFIENISKLVITCAVFSGLFVATGLYLIWQA